MHPTPSPLNYALYHRLEEFVKKKNDNFGKLTRSIGVSSAFFTNFKQRKCSIGSETLMKLLLFYPELSAEWLLRGTGNMIIGARDVDDVIRFQAVEELTNELSSEIEKTKKAFDQLEKTNKKLQKVRNKR